MSTTTTTPDVTELIREAQAQALATLEQVQQVSLKTAEAAAAFIPSADWPVPAGFPKPTEVVDAAFGFYGKVLETQKAHALRLAGLAGAQVGDVKKAAS